MRQTVKQIARRVGLEVATWRPPERRLAEFLTLARIGTVLDVGANRGQFGHELRAAGFAGMVVSFEPLAAPFADLEAAAGTDARWRVHRLALGRERAAATMNIAANTSSSSLLGIRDVHVDIFPEAATVGREDVQIRRLDEIWPTLEPLDGNVLLKLDVQGFHLDVLEGAAGVLDRIAGVQCELSVRPLYDGEPALLDVLSVLRGHGFELVELEPGFYDRRTGAVLQFDGRFTRPRR